MCILFVEDEVVIAMVMQDVFQDAGHEVVLAGHAADAVLLLSQNVGRFICVVTDIHLPGELTGIDLAEHVREHYPAIPVVVATGRPDVVKPEWCQRHAIPLLVKPYPLETLVKIVEGLLRGENPAMPPGGAIGCKFTTPPMSRPGSRVMPASGHHAEPGQVASVENGR